MNNNELKHAIAKKMSKYSKTSDYFLSDADLFLNVLSEIARECIEKREELNVYGLGRIQYFKQKAHEGSKPTKGMKGTTEKIMVSETEVVRFKLSSDLREIVKKDYQKEEF